MDPAGSYDFGSWNMQYNIFEQLMEIPAGETEPDADAAESCDYDDPQTITCTLEEGHTFSNGNELTSSDVLFSFKRNIEIADPNGSSVLLGQLSNGDDKTPTLAEGAIETPDDTTVVFHLNQPDTTFLKLLSTATTSIVDEETFPADELLGDSDVIGSGPYTLDKYKPGEQATLVANDGLHRDRTSRPARQIFVQYLSEPSALKTAVETGQVDVAWRTLSPDRPQRPRVRAARSTSSRARALSSATGSGSSAPRSARTRRSARRSRRSSIATSSPRMPTTAPSPRRYSIVPPGFGGQKDSFEEKYGEPSADKAKQILERPGSRRRWTSPWATPPPTTAPTPSTRPPSSPPSSRRAGCSTVKTQDAEWEEYQTLYKQNAYDLFILGWYPDILDADNYLTPFVRDGGFYANGYSNDEVNGLLDQELAETDSGARDELIGQLQDIVAEDVPLIPSWNGKNVAVASKQMEGVAETLDPTYIFRFWDISKSS